MVDTHENGLLEELDMRFQDALTSRRRGELEISEDELCCLISEYEDIGALHRLAMVRINLAQVLQMMGRLDEAVSAYVLALDDARLDDDLRRIGLCLSGMSTIRMEQGRLDESERLLVEAEKIFREMDDPIGLGNQLGNKGLLFQNQGRLEEALECYSLAAQYFVMAGNASGSIGVLQCLGELHRRQCEFSESEAAHQQAIDLAIQSGNVLARAHSHRALGQIYRVGGDLALAETHTRKGLSFHEAAGDQRGSLSVLIDLASIEFAKGKGAVAIHLLDQCISGARSMGMVSPLGKALLNQALYLLDTEQFESVQNNLKEAKSCLTKLNDPAAWIIWSVTTARTLIRAGRWDESEEALREMLERSGPAHMASARPAILGILGSIESLRGKTSEALTLFEESESLYRALGDTEGARMSVVSRARLLSESGETTQALEALGRLWQSATSQRTRQPVLEAEILAARAGALSLQGDFAQALTTANRAAERYRSAGFITSEIGINLAISTYATNAHRRQGDSLPCDHIDTLHKLYSRAETLHCPTMLTMAKSAYADALFLGGQHQESKKLALGALRTAEDLDFPDGRAHALEILARLGQDRHLAIKAHRIWSEIESSVRATQLRDEWGLTSSEIDLGKK